MESKPESSKRDICWEWGKLISEYNLLLISSSLGHFSGKNQHTFKATGKRWPQRFLAWETMDSLMGSTESEREIAVINNIYDDSEGQISQRQLKGSCE